ncbi:hypothetical protein HOY80DRAFT_1096258 [Tuber brumale]|nr:hypothetical protein HOY80DRAFT_1096258 [Tuber brumale]
MSTGPSLAPADAAALAYLPATNDWEQTATSNERTATGDRERTANGDRERTANDKRRTTYKTTDVEMNASIPSSIFGFPMASNTIKPPHMTNILNRHATWVDCLKILHGLCELCLVIAACETGPILVIRLTDVGDQSRMRLHDILPRKSEVRDLSLREKARLGVAIWLI